MREGEYSRKVVISNIAHWKLLQNYFVILFIFRAPRNKGKSEIHEHYHRKNCNKTLQSNNQMKACLIFEVSTFNLTGRE